jgi:hypothetical protein
MANSPTRGRAHILCDKSTWVLKYYSILFVTEQGKANDSLASVKVSPAGDRMEKLDDEYSTYSGYKLKYLVLIKIVGRAQNSS